MKSNIQTNLFKTFAFIFLLFTTFACKKEERKIIGTWSWIESVHGWTGTTTPESTGDTRELKISSSLIKQYLNDSLISELPFSIVDSPNDDCAYITLDINDYRTCAEVSNKVLTLTPMDVTDQGYTRWKKK